MNYLLELSSYIFLVIFALIPIANPFSTAPLFVSMTVNSTKEERNAIAKRAAIYMFVLLVIFLLFGSMVLNFFGIHMPALRIAGGLIVAFIGFRMVFSLGEATKSTDTPESESEDVAFTPLAMPMLSGPGSISVVMTMATQVSLLESFTEQAVGYLVVTLGIAVSAFICWIVLRASTSVVRFMGKNGIDALTKVMGFLLVSIGLEFIIAGLRLLGVIQ